MVKATQSPGRLNRVARHVVGTSQPSPAPTGAVSLAVGALVGAGAALVWQQQQQQKRSAATEEDLPAVAGQVMSPRQSGWVAPEKPCETTAGGIDFSRSRVTFRIDLAMKPSATMSDEPPFDMNTPVIPIDCVLTVTERSTGRSEVIVLGGNCKTETVGVPANIWMAPNADFVPIYSSSKALTIKTYDRFGKAVLYSAATGDKRAPTQGWLGGCRGWMQSASRAPQTCTTLTYPRRPILPGPRKKCAQFPAISMPASPHAHKPSVDRSDWNHRMYITPLESRVRYT
jgi:hypothetical protein